MALAKMAEGVGLCTDMHSGTASGIIDSERVRAHTAPTESNGSACESPALNEAPCRFERVCLLAGIPSHSFGAWPIGTDRAHADLDVVACILRFPTWNGLISTAVFFIHWHR